MWITSNQVEARILTGSGLHITYKVQNPKLHFVHVHCHKVTAAAHLNLLRVCLIASEPVKHSLFS